MKNNANSHEAGGFPTVEAPQRVSEWCGRMWGTFFLRVRWIFDEPLGQKRYSARSIPCNAGAVHTRLVYYSTPPRLACATSRLVCALSGLACAPRASSVPSRSSPAPYVCVFSGLSRFLPSWIRVAPLHTHT